MIKRLIKLWHRRLGITSALVVIFLSLSGLALNHLDSLYKPQTFVSSSWLLNWYQIPLPTVLQRYQINHSGPEKESTEVVWSDGTLFINQAPVLFDKQEILGISLVDDILYLFLRNELHLFTVEGERVESINLQNLNSSRFDKVYGTEVKEVVGLKTEGEEIYLFDLLDMIFVEGTPLPTSLQDNLNESLPPSNSDIELARSTVLLKSKVIQDLHSGRFFGRLGPYVMDLFAFAFIFLGLSGVFLWLRKSKKKSKN